MSCNLLIIEKLIMARVIRKFPVWGEVNLSIQPALAYEETSMLESSVQVEMAAKQ